MGIFDIFKKGLEKTKNGFLGKALSILKGGNLDKEKIEEIMELLLLSDVGVSTSDYIVERVKESKEKDAIDALKKVLLELLGPDESITFASEGPTIYTLVGVNGSGKTTTAGKLAFRFKKEGKRVVLGAGDTFRAAAIDQLKEWGRRVGVPVISHQWGADAGAVVYDTVTHAISEKLDVALIDTAGRLHTKDNLMRELEKIHKIIKKLKPDQPQEVLLVLDSTIGQNAIQQAKIFGQSTGVTGIVLTKFDGTAKGGMIFSIKKELNIPVKLIGIGEGLEDLKDFKATEFIDALLE
ncbi:MAG: signal recognition particle-docking protein FtsY [Mesoaciditoga sp.]|uniref:signal recognition particle-docking protein FtsY n=1 Tax=Athalassotoga sp. TaxID=2022597 RepID=UPI000CC78087|nr:MAG: signal recognition particle-docking protein FtsY [Mesoaciditoga sp.]PMP80846.1 MAG: signal recognition particle-docking protein FtsY [Mesoaciditoga sp.]HEU24162.1 signal recognition particle-docking protein FtsY [Mesoaciditoga lauensis]